MTAISSTIQHVKKDQPVSIATNRRLSVTRKHVNYGQKVSASTVLVLCAIWRSKSLVRPHHVSGRTNREAAANHTACFNIKYRRRLQLPLTRLQPAAWSRKYHNLQLEPRPLLQPQQLICYIHLPQLSFWIIIMRPYCLALFKNENNSGLEWIAPMSNRIRYLISHSPWLGAFQASRSKSADVV